MGSKKISLIIAILVGFVALVGLLLWARGLESESSSNSDLATVYVVETAIEKGSGKDIVVASVVRKELPGEFVPDNAISDPESQIQDGHLAVADFGPGHTIVSTDFASRRVSGSGLSAVLSERGLVSVTVSADPGAWGAGMIQPGDRVNVLSVASAEPFWLDDKENASEYLTQRSSEELNAARATALLTSSYVPSGLRTAIGISADDAVPAIEDLSQSQLENAVEWVVAQEEITWLRTQLTQNTTRYLLQDVEVIAINSNLVADLGDETTGTAIAGEPAQALITLAVAPEDVQVILDASAPNSAGGSGLYFSLVPESYEAKAMGPLDYSRQIAPGEDPTRLSSEANGNILNDLGGLSVGSLNAAASEASDEADLVNAQPGPEVEPVAEEGEQ